MASFGAADRPKRLSWQVNSGETFNAWNTDLRNVNRYAAFYAEEYRDEGLLGAVPVMAGI
jgi:hypothetical protein